MAGLAGNLVQVARNVGFTLIQDTGALKTNAAILASLGVVAGRTAEARKSLAQAQLDQSDKLDFIEEQTASTCFREWGGFTLGYGFMRGVDITLRQGINFLFGARAIKPESTTPLDGIRQSLALLLGQRHEVTPHPEVFSGKVLVKTGESGFRFKPLLEAVGKRLVPAEEQASLLKKLGSQSKLTHVLAERGLKALSHWIPVVTGTVAGCYLAGWQLERLSVNDRLRQAVLDVMRGKTTWSEAKQALAEDAVAETIPSKTANEDGALKTASMAAVMPAPAAQPLQGAFYPQPVHQPVEALNPLQAPVVSLSATPRVISNPFAASTVPAFSGSLA
jgi:hypothetical protein